MSQLRSLADLGVGQRARVSALRSGGALRRRLLDIGLIQDTAIECVGCSPAGDPRAYLIRGAVIAIRERDGRDIMISFNEG